MFKLNQVNVEHQKQGGKAQKIDVPSWKFEDLHMNLITGLSHASTSKFYMGDTPFHDP